MESERFDALIRETYEGATRRGVVRVGAGALVASALGMLGLASGADAKKKHKKRCKGKRPVKCGRRGCCPEAYSQCCDDAFYAKNGHSCNPTDYTCCPLDQGGGSCSPDAPQCCPATTQSPYGSCTEADAICCTSDEGGFACSAGTICCPVTDINPSGACCPDAADCCDVDEDCVAPVLCIEGCCGGVARSAGNSGHSAKKVGVNRFRKKAK